MECKKTVMVTMSAEELKGILGIIDKLLSDEDIPYWYVTKARETVDNYYDVLDAAEANRK